MTVVFTPLPCDVVRAGVDMLETFMLKDNAKRPEVSEMLASMVVVQENLAALRSRTAPGHQGLSTSRPGPGLERPADSLVQYDLAGTAQGVDQYLFCI